MLNVVEVVKKVCLKKYFYIFRHSTLMFFFLYRFTKNKCINYRIGDKLRKMLPSKVWLKPL